MSTLARSCLCLLFDAWLTSWMGKAMSLLMPSILHLIQPTSPNKRKKLSHVASRRYKKKMADFTEEVRQLFEAPLQYERLLEMSVRMQEEYREKLQESDISMLPSYQHTLPSGEEKGEFLALDVGGSTLRIALVRLDGRHGEGLQIRRLRKFVIDEGVRRLKGEEFFDWMAGKISEMKAEYNFIQGTSDERLQMGITWSFPIEQTSPSSGRLLRMGKGFRADHGLEKEDIGELIMQACQRRGLNVDMRAIINDSSATLLSQAYRDSATRMSLILGTGMNAAVFLPVPIIGNDKFGIRPDGWLKTAERVVVNTELSMFGKRTLQATKWDDELNAKHALPDFQPLEYLITGRYLGEIVRLVMLEAIASAGLFDGQIPKGLSEPYTFDTKTLARFESDKSPTLANACSAFMQAHPLPTLPSLRQLQFIRDVGRVVSKRAAAYLAVSLHALWAVRTASEGIAPGGASHVTIACTGSMVEKYPDFRHVTQQYLDRLSVMSGSAEGAVTLEIAAEGSIFGAAVAVSCR